MKEILVYHGKHGDLYWDASDKSQALWLLFKHLDENMEYYSEISDVEEVKKLLAEQVELREKIQDEMSSAPNLREGAALLLKQAEERIVLYKDEHRQAVLYRNAKAGQVASAIALLNHRIDYEYESWEFDHLEEE